jgi:REP element-mobilizing transposase RayT
MGGEMCLNEYGGIVMNCWDDLPNHYAHIELDTLIIMPNHMHGIIAVVVGAGLKPAPFLNNNDKMKYARYRAGFKPAPTISKQHGLSEIVRAFKSFSSRRINKIRNTPGIPLWQRNYFEHIIRNKEELEKTREYIVNNPLNWESDENYEY